MDWCKIANSLTEQCEHKIFLISGFWSDYRPHVLYRSVKYG